VATVLLVRHATTALTATRLVGRTPGIGLDDAGRAQATDVAQRLAGVHLTAVYSSPLARAEQTAAAIAAPRGLSVRTLDGVGEVDYGRWTGRTYTQLRRLRAWWPVMATPGRVTFPGGEPLRDVQRRAVDALEQLATEHRVVDAVVVVSHADVIRSVVGWYLGAPFDLLQRISVDPASVTVLSMPRTGVVRVERVNDTGALGPRP